MIFYLTQLVTAVGTAFFIKADPGMISKKNQEKIVAVFKIKLKSNLNTL